MSIFVDEKKLGEQAARILAEQREAFTSDLKAVLAKPIRVKGTFGGVQVDAVIQIGDESNEILKGDRERVQGPGAVDQGR